VSITNNIITLSLISIQNMIFMQKIT